MHRVVTVTSQWSRRLLRRRLHSGCTVAATLGRCHCGCACTVFVTVASSTGSASAAAPSASPTVANPWQCPSDGLHGGYAVAHWHSGSLWCTVPCCWLQLAVLCHCAFRSQCLTVAALSQWFRTVVDSLHCRSVSLWLPAVCSLRLHGKGSSQWQTVLHCGCRPAVSVTVAAHQASQITLVSCLSQASKDLAGFVPQPGHTGPRGQLAGNSTQRSAAVLFP